MTIEEFYQIVGELEVVRRKQVQQLQMFLKQVDEMSAEMDRLRAQNGGLVKADNNQ